MLKGRRIIIGVTGGIAAYKIPMLVRLLKKQKADVQVVMTAAAAEFVTPLTLSTLSGNPVHKDFVKNERGEWDNHVELGMWADLLILAPATANTLSKMVHGTADNLLLTVYLSARCPVVVAPAMDMDMYKHPSTRKNLDQLKKEGILIIPPGTGELASGLSGEGRMAEPEDILAFIKKHFQKSLPLFGKTALVTAGPTHEAIDPVRFIGNHSSGKMGVAIADELCRKGAEVTLVAGPGTPEPKTGGIRVVHVQSADQMLKACLKAAPKCELIVKAAAVADFKPTGTAKSKIKKEKAPETISLSPTTDILAALGKKKKKGQILIGFALETDDGMASAKKKIRKKNLDAIVLNTLRDKGAGFGTETNKITILTRNNKTIKFGLKPKTEVAGDIVEFIIKLIRK